MATFEESSLSSWAGPYVTEMLGRGQALGSQPYTPYQGPLTAGQSGLQQQAFSGLAGLSAPTNMGAYTPQSFTGAGYTAPANQYQSSQQSAPSGMTRAISDWGPNGESGTFQPDGSIRLNGTQQSAPSGMTPEQRMEYYMSSRPPERNNDLQNPTILDQQSHLDGYWGEGGNPNAIENRRTYDPNNRMTLEDIRAQMDDYQQRQIAAQDRFDVANPNYEYRAGAGPVRTPTNRAAEQAEQERRQAMFPPLEYDPTTLSPVRNSPVADRGITSNPRADSVVEQYMSPYLEGALQPQYEAANRQAQIQQQAMQSRYGKAGAYGGSRQAVAGAELDRGLLDRMAGITGTGYQNAFEQAQKQFNTEQDRQMTAQQRTNQYGLDVLGAQQTGGALQRGIEQEGIAADYAQFREERDYDKNNTLYMQSLLQGLPLETQTYSYSEPSGLQNVAGGVQDVTNILDLLSGNSSSEAVAPEFQSLVDFYVSQGRTPEQAANDANAILGTG